MSRLTEEIKAQTGSRWKEIEREKRQKEKIKKTLSNSFTIGQVRAVLELFRALDKKRDPEKILRREEIGAVVLKFRGLEAKYKKAQERG